MPHNLILGLWSPVPLLKFQVAPRLIFLISSGSKKKEPRCVCLLEANASHSHRMWLEVSSTVPHFLLVGLFRILRLAGLSEVLHIRMSLIVYFIAFYSVHSV